ncbi:MAG: hypothetical protein H5U20_02485 [Rhodobacteraceae bacterium]|nr:hypothetical protein [Paracoccaceae bacterium]
MAQALAAALAGGGTPAPAAPVGPPLSGAETDGLRRAISSCWNLGSASSEALRTTVVVGVSMAADGRPQSVRLISSDGATEAATATAFDAARRAIQRCIADANLPADKYATWAEIEMVFNPDGMRLR